MSISEQSGFSALSKSAAALAHLMLRPQLIAFVCLALLVFAGWGWVALHAGSLASEAGFTGLGPGMAIFDRLALPGWLTTLCRSLIPVYTDPGWQSLAVSFLMWAAMSAAMMLPSAAPMVVTYAEIADTAARKGEPIVSPLILIAGYLTVWLLFSIAAAALQLMLQAYTLASAAGQLTSPYLAAALLCGAGLYQFSALKQACLAKCRRPFTFFLANWRDTASGVLKLGLRQGVYCLGCCWALMLLMLVVGTMNIVWMALFGALMIAEKTVTQSAPLRKATGIALLFAAIAVAASLVFDHMV